MSRVLIVDDERNVLKTLSLVLQRYEYSVVQAQNGPDALKVLDQEPCDFVVSDIRMSPMDGYTLASLIHQKYPQIGIVFMSAFGFDDANPDSAHTSGFPKLTKPFPVSDLVRVLKEEEDKRKKTGNGQQKKQSSKHIVILGDEIRNQDVFEQLKSMGLNVEIVPAGGRVEQSLQNRPADLFLVDEAVLAGENWKVLNTIDQIAPQKPVMLLTDRAEVEDPRIVHDLNITVLNRKRIFKDPAWTHAFVLQHLQHEGNIG